MKRRAIRPLISTLDAKLAKGEITPKRYYRRRRGLESAKLLRRELKGKRA